MSDNNISCVLTEPTLRIFGENTPGWLQLKYEGTLAFKINSLLRGIYKATRYCYPQSFTKSNYWNFETGTTAHVYDPQAVNIALAV